MWDSSEVHAILNFSNTLEQAIRTIEKWSDKLEAWNDKELQQQVDNLNQQHLRHSASAWLWSGHPFARPFVDCHKEFNIHVASAFLDYIINRKIGNLANKDIFQGTLAGYEFQNQDSDIVKRRNGERESIEYLQNRLYETTGNLIGETEKFKNDFLQWDEQNRQHWIDWLKKALGDHQEQQEGQRREFVAYLDDCRTRIDELENTYQEKLRLEKPAQYWKLAARRYGIQGGLWALFLLASLILGFTYFSGFFADWLRGQEVAVKLNTIQGVVIFGTVLAIYAFLLRTLSRLTFSAFHLMRDAQEREQLTYLYLSLVNEGAIDESSRDIVLQALFSRSETGLLASESGPTMPSVSEFIRSATKIN